MKPVIFSDVDGTICFHVEANGIRVHKTLEDNCAIVSDPASNARFKAHDVSTSSYAVYLAEQTRELAHKLSQTHDIVLVTGGRPATCQRRAPLLDFATAVIAENGGIIFDRDFNRDEEWWQKLQTQRLLLKDVRAYIKSYDWNIDDEGRTSALRVRLRDNPHKDAEKFQRLCDVVRLPNGLQRTINLENLDIILDGAGKDKAVSHFLHSRGYDPARSFAIGDDINDTPFLRVCQHQYVLCSAYPQVLEEAQKCEWYVSSFPTFEGIHEILKQISATSA